MVQSGRRPSLAAEPLLDSPVAGHVARQELQRHAAAQRDLLGLVDDAHAPPADLAEDPVIADLPQWRTCGPGIPVHLLIVLARWDPLGLFHSDHCREELADLLGKLRVAVGVFLERGTLAAPEASRKFLGQLIKQVVLS